MVLLKYELLRYEYNEYINEFLNTVSLNFLQPYITKLTNIIDLPWLKTYLLTYMTEPHSRNIIHKITDHLPNFFIINMKN